MLPSNYPTIHGWCSIDKANILIDLVKQSDPNLIVEFGVFGGKSLLALALAVKHKQIPCKVIGIDSWTAEASLEGTNDKPNDDWWSKIDYNDIYGYAKNLMVTNGVSSFVELWKDKSRNVSSKFENDSIDILHQDSNHSEEITCEEVELYWNKIKKGGIWIFDDTNWATTQKAQSLLVSKGYSVIYESSQTDSASCWKVYCRKE
jgi:predicted O-methyltransferase YrrM